MSKSSYSDYHLFIIRPAGGRGCVTVKDQLALGFIFPQRRSSWRALFFETPRREEKLRRMLSARLSKRMLVTEITDKQYSMRHRLPETIAGTGIHATARQLSNSFTI